MAHSFIALNRAEALAKAPLHEYDLVIIGGGITGAGIARECALRGLSCCLLEKNDFAFGTSSRSSKLFHGGLRYLASGEVCLVRESTSERNWLRCHFPNLVRPLAFVYPSYTKSKSTPVKIRLAVLLYTLISDCFSKYKNYRRGKIFKASLVEEIEPAVTLEDPDLGKMTIAGFYYDTNCDDARVTLEIIKESVTFGHPASCAANYAAVVDFIRNSNGLVRGVTVKDLSGGKTFNVRAKAVVSAAGIWTDQLLASTQGYKERIYPTKGVHIIVPAHRLGNRNAFSLVSIDDNRFFFVLRRGSVSVIGTTDTAYYPESTDLDHPWCTREDCDYLLRTVNRIFPHAHLTDRDIISAYAGIRPLIRAEGAKHESDVSRRHEIFTTADGITAIAGGKSTTHRKMAEDLIYFMAKKGLIKKFDHPEYYRKGFSRQPFKVGLDRPEFDRLLKEKQMDHLVEPEQATHFYNQYGRGALAIIEAIASDPAQGKALLRGYPHCQAEFLYILEHEAVEKLSDLLCRRTEAQWMIKHTLQAELAEKAATIMARCAGWNDSRKKAEIAEYLNYVYRNVQFLDI